MTRDNISLIDALAFLGLLGFVMGWMIYRFAHYYAERIQPDRNKVALSKWRELFVGLVCTLITCFDFYMLPNKDWAWLTLILTWTLLLLFLIDLKTWLLPDLLTLPLLWLGLMIHDFGVGGVSLHDALWGAVIGYSLPWLIKTGYFLLTQRQGMGQGDFKLLAALGAWLGWQALPLVLLLSSSMGLVVGLFLMWWRRKSLTMALPFGPFLAVAGYLILLKQSH
ncbi:MAG: hypothetical protein B7Z65_01605 [Ferrovum sp. 21-44-67]|nr:MAG: hypothetical protein B7Z65_01605 [Ferrovum sp. 21-44-67]